MKREAEQSGAAGPSPGSMGGGSRGAGVRVIHPSGEDLLRHALHAKDVWAAGTLSDHVATCAACAAEVARLRAVAAALGTGAPRPDDPSAGCLSEDTTAALSEGSLDAAARAPALAHLADCAACRLAVASVTRVLMNKEVERAAVGADPRQRRWRLAAIPVAAAALLVVLLWSRPMDDGAPHRAPAITTVRAPTPLAPAGAVSPPATLMWTAVPLADRYRVTVFDASGDVVFETQVADTLARLPDAFRVVPGQPYLWKVEARIGFDRWVSSDLTPFTVGPGP